MNGGRRPGRRLWTAGALVLALAAIPMSAQRGSPQAPAPKAPAALDRSKVPPPAKTAALRVPTWMQYTLDNGAVLLVSEKRDLPLVSFTITLVGGADQFERADRRGVGSLAAAMLSEGTARHDGEALSKAWQLLGTTASAAVGSETGSIGFTVTTSKFAKALDLLAEMLVQPAFPAPALERLRGQRLVALTQAKSQPAAMANRVFPRLLYGPAHPFGQPVTEETISAITRDDIVAFHRTYFQPARAIVTVVGDVAAASVEPAIDRALSGWPAGGGKGAFAYPPPAERRPTAIYLVDRPGAAQSTFVIGHPGPPRSTPDFFALQVMNTMLGGMFQSRLNANLRENKGYSYGVSSSFAFGRGPGAFRTGGDVVSAKTDAALIEFMKELRGITGARPVTDEELATAKESLIQRLPGTFSSVQSIGSALTTLMTQELPLDYYRQYAAKVGAVTKADVVRVAKLYLDLDRLVIVIVGDKASIEGPLRATGVAPVVVTGIDGSS